MVESDRILAAERQLTEVTCDLTELAAERAVTDWILAALRNFGRVWEMLTADNKGRLLRAMVSKTTVNEAKGSIALDLINLTGATRNEGGGVSEQQLESGGAERMAAGTTVREDHVVTAIFRTRGRRVRFAAEPAPEPPPPPEPVRRPAKVAKMLALARHIQWAIERGDVADAAIVAQRLGLTRVRVCQLLDLVPVLASELQEEILGLEAVDGAEPTAEPTAERGLRRVVRVGSWERQRVVCASVCASMATGHHPEG